VITAAPGIARSPLLVRILHAAVHELRDEGADLGADDISRWLRESRVGNDLTTYLRGEAELLGMAASRLGARGDEELRPLSRELARSADRLTLLGDPGDE